jgi:hypothetical protein
MFGWLVSYLTESLMAFLMTEKICSRSSVQFGTFFYSSTTQYMPSKLTISLHLHPMNLLCNFTRYSSLRLNNFSPSTSSPSIQFLLFKLCVFMCISHLRENCYFSLLSHPPLFRHRTSNHLFYACEVWGKLFSLFIFGFEHNQVDSAWIQSITGKRKSLNGPVISNI